LIESRYYREPEGDRRTNAWKDKLKEEAAKHPGKIGVRGSDWDLGLKLRDSVYAHKAARALLEADGGFEQTMFWDNTETGERCKALYDKTSVGKNFHADLKSTVCAAPRDFMRSIWNYRYDVQGAHYTDASGLRFAFIAVEKTPPYAVAVYALDDEWLRTGVERRMPNLRDYARCRATGKWPAYPQTIQHIGRERWMKP
jgi:exodeoxyribonuclease VIII